MEKEQNKQKPETVVVNKDALAQLMKTVKKQGEEIKTLTAVADKSRIEWYRGTRQPASKELKRVTVGTYPTKDGNRIVLGWTDMPLNEMFQDSNGNWNERQIMRLILAGKDGTAEGSTQVDINYADWVKRRNRVDCQILSRSVNEETGTETLKVETKDGRKLEIVATFVNV